MNISNNIWGFKQVIGSNDSFCEEMGSKVNVENKDRAIYNVKYDGKDISIDSEVVMSLVLQYCYYRCLRSESIGYDTFPMELPKLLEQPHSMTIAVCFASSSLHRSPTITPHPIFAVWPPLSICADSAMQFVSVRMLPLLWTTVTTKPSRRSSPNRVILLLFAIWVELQPRLQSFISRMYHWMVGLMDRKEWRSWVLAVSEWAD